MFYFLFCFALRTECLNLSKIIIFIHKQTDSTQNYDHVEIFKSYK
jgi:hypothetical protein